MGNYIKVLLVFLLLQPISVPAWQSNCMVVLGDSLSAGYGVAADKGWVDLLRQRLARQGKPWQVVNGSISGETTAGGLSRLPGLLQRHQPDIVIIQLGSNDGLRGLSFRKMRENLKTMITAVEKTGAKVVLVGGRLPPNYGTAFTEAFYQSFHKLADEHDLPLVPFLLHGAAQDFSLMQADGLHPTAEAQPILLENVWPVLESVLEPREKPRALEVQRANRES
jgi:acyl-CoA thioesterase-1